MSFSKRLLRALRNVISATAQFIAEYVEIATGPAHWQLYPQRDEDEWTDHGGEA